MTDNKKIMNDEKLEQVAGGGRINPRPNPFSDYNPFPFSTVKDDKEFKEPIDSLVKEIMKNPFIKDKSWEIKVKAAIKDK